MEIYLYNHGEHCFLIQSKINLKDRLNFLFFPYKNLVQLANMEANVFNGSKSPISLPKDT